MKNESKSESPLIGEPRCCDVPTDLHGTCCGWENASAQCSSEMIITDQRHPGFGQHLDRWKRTYMDGSEGSYDITEKSSYGAGWDAAMETVKKSKPQRSAEEAKDFLFKMYPKHLWQKLDSDLITVEKAAKAMEEYASQWKQTAKNMDVMLRDYAAENERLKAKEESLPEATEPDELFEEAEAIMVRKFPPEEYGEDGDLSAIYDILRELRDLAKTESKEDNKAFGEQDLKAAFEAGKESGWCKVHKTFQQWMEETKLK